MQAKTLQQKAEEASCKCCKADFGSMLDNQDCTEQFEFYYDSQAQAEQALDYYTAAARAVESEPCEICSAISETENGWQLAARFQFCCEAELMLFRLRAG